MANELVHKAVELSKVKVAQRKVLEQEGYLEQNYIALRKYDGCCCIILAHDIDNIQILSRTGEEVKSMDHIKEGLAWQMLYNVSLRSGGFVLFGEAHVKGLPFAEISGLFRRQYAAPNLAFVPWDSVALSEYNSGRSFRPFKERLSFLHRNFGDIVAHSYNPGTYGKAQDLCNLLVAEGGYDGLILKDPNGYWIQGPGTGGQSIKVKQKLSFDLRVTGVEEGLGRNNGKVGRLTVSYHGKALGVGTGLSDAQRAAWWGAGASEIIGQIVEVEAMGFSSEGLLREPRLKGIRYDKTKADDE